MKKNKFFMLLFVSGLLFSNSDSSQANFDMLPTFLYHAQQKQFSFERYPLLF